MVEKVVTQSYCMIAAMFMVAKGAYTIFKRLQDLRVMCWFELASVWKGNMYGILLVLLNYFTEFLAYCRHSLNSLLNDRIKYC